jgi:hypothetical protein
MSSATYEYYWRHIQCEHYSNVLYYKQLSEFRSIQEVIQTAITVTLSSDDNLIIRLLN